MIKILFTGVGRKIELVQSFRNAALVLNKELKIYGADMAGTAPALVYCDYVRRVVAIKNHRYIYDLLEICKEEGIDLLIPTIDTDLLEYSRAAEPPVRQRQSQASGNVEPVVLCRERLLI